MNPFARLAIALCCLGCLHAVAQAPKAELPFRQAYNELSAMLAGSEPLNYERAVFLTEQAYRQDSLSYSHFEAALDVQTALIQQLAAANDHYSYQVAKAERFKIDLETEEVVKERYRQALANWAIYTYLTDTTYVETGGLRLAHLPFVYNTADPYGTNNLATTQVTHLLETGQGNCYALAVLFRIFSERLHSDARLVTAPHHIYIEHADPRGDLFNIELPTHSFPGAGSIMTLTYTTREALINNLTMHPLDNRQAVALCLVYLAKGYESVFHDKGADFVLQCAEKALEHDSVNLNALLLKAQVLEKRVENHTEPPASYLALLGKLHRSGYRQMPDDIKELILANIQGRTQQATEDRTPKAFTTLQPKKGVVSLSGGVFDEQGLNASVVRIGRTVFDWRKNRIAAILAEDKVQSYEVDPVVFALSVDPLMRSYPELTPYQFASNRPIEAVDLDGLEANDLSMALEPVRSLREEERKKGIVHPESNGEKVIKYFVAGGLGAVVTAPALSLASVESVTMLLYRGAATAYANPEVIIGTTGLVGSLVDPNPNTDYPGSFDDVLRGGKLLLGKADRLKEYALGIKDAFHMFKSGFGLGIPNSLAPRQPNATGHV